MIVRTALAQINTTVGDINGNKNKIIEAIDQATASDSEILLFPELTITGYPPEDLLLNTGFLRENLAALKEIANYTEGSKTMIVLGFVDFSNEIYNAAAVIHSGEIRAVYRKMSLPNYSVFDERRYFSPGSHPLLARYGEANIGINICEDLWVPSGPINEQAIGGANLILNLSASPFSGMKSKTRSALLLTRAMEYSSIIVYVNLVGGQDDLVFDGRSCVAMPDGRLLLGKAFEEDMILLDIDTDVSTRYNLFEGKRKDYSMQVSLEEVSITPSHRQSPSVNPDSSCQELCKYDELIAALEIGIRDYVKKNGFKKVVLGLSGGMDSSLVAALAVRAIGNDNVKGVMMPSRITSGESKRDALELVNNLQIEGLEIPIDDIMCTTLSTLEPVFTGTSEDITEENLQARIRGMILMALSNKFGWLVLITGNKSEMATGYATLYGDMAGGFAVLKDLYKTQVYRIAERINELAKRDMIPRNVFSKAPSAELREGQKDQDSLPPYEILDEILRLHIEEGQSAEEIVLEGFERDTVEHSLKLLRRSEYKRKQCPPGIKVSKRAFGKDWRMPITNHY
ncbi:NAD+ synthetase [Mesotoga prima MesG1.Ag.4.2]|uniref:Glutamine-dependent NAD(+) synthetase n=1 Tax=Mesotoga prima MesG1.Ag.4.2 TaxID=660470 RepID=I2F7D7_9BACT|nr:NAD+ synthase [Mesotoga prima]AFK07840.1 NAD+ synthetase [Mesotoga prima MesG1.Ag.4.2]